MSVRGSEEANQTFKHHFIEIVDIGIVLLAILFSYFFYSKMTFSQSVTTDPPIAVTITYLMM